MITLNNIIDSFKQSVNQNVVDSLQEAGYDNDTATKMVTQFEGLGVDDLTFESDSQF